jgi:hypothetical protein
MHHIKFNSVFFSVAVLFSLLLFSCEKEVHINLGSSPTTPVVQGAIENGLPPYVFLTSTIGFFSTVDLATLEASFLHGAVIKVSDGTKTVTLKEYTLDTGSNGNKLYVYSIDTTDPMVGVPGTIYNLTITYNGTTYTSSTKIPSLKGIDSMWFDTPLFKRTKTPDSGKQIFVNFTDPDTPGNYTRYFTKRNSQQFFASDQYNDQVVNGQKLTQIPLLGGYVKNRDIKNEDSLRYFFPGDTVTVKWCQIDKGVYDFWNTYAFAQNALGNPFSSPINVQSNITNGALGVWAGYGSVSITKVVP